MRVLTAGLLCLLLAPATAWAHPGHAPPAPTARMAQDGTIAACPGAPIAPTQVVTGSFAKEQERTYVMVPFDVPDGTTAVRVKYCYDKPELPTAQSSHTIDLGLYDARDGGGELWGEGEFRGWGGSSHPDVTVSPEGFSSEEQYRADPKGHVPGKTTRGFLPGPVPAGQWAVELGVAAVVGREEGDLDGRVAYRVELELRRDPAFADEPYAPAPYDASPARREAGWYAGDLHVHAEHSALGDATMRETFDYAFAPAGEGAGLDFVTLSDYVAGSSWGEIGRHQGRYPGKLVTRSAEVITYRGHANNQVSVRYSDHRLSPVFERLGDGSLVERRGQLSPRTVFDAVHAGGGFTQVNHPTIFPSAVPLFANLCRGCPWDYSDAETDWDKVDAYEVHTGPPGNLAGSNPFTTTAIREYDRLRRAGHRLAAVAVSDSHNAGRTPNAVTQAPIGTGTTVVHAPELSEAGVRAGVLAGRTYAKVFGASSADLRLELRNDRGEAMIGGSLPGDTAQLSAKVLGGDGRTLQVLRDGRVIDTVAVRGADFEHRMRVSGRGDYRLQVLRGAAVDALTTPVTLGREDGASGTPGTRPPRAGARMRVRATPRLVRHGRLTRLRVRVTDVRGAGLRGAVVRVGSARARTDRRGGVTIPYRFVGRPGLRRVRAWHRGHRSASALIRVQPSRLSLVG